MSRYREIMLDIAHQATAATQPHGLASGPSGAFEEQIDRLQSLQELVANAQVEAVREARARSASWDWIGGQLGISRQAAHQRFAALVD